MSDGLEPPSYRDNPHTIYPVESTTPICFVGMVRYHQFESHAYRRILLSVSSRAANYAPHRLTMLHGELSATSPAHHRMAINHLLHRLDMMCFLALGATQKGKYDYYSKSCGRSYLPFYKGFPVYLIFQSVGKSVTNLRGTDIPCLPYIWRCAIWIIRRY